MGSLSLASPYHRTARTETGGPRTVASSRPRRELRWVTATTAAGFHRATYPRIWVAVGGLYGEAGVHNASTGRAMARAPCPP
jgi:hypothetical protein